MQEETETAEQLLAKLIVKHMGDEKDEIAAAMASSHAEEVALFSSIDYQLIGHVLRGHLVIEYYVNLAIDQAVGEGASKLLRLTFAQKALILKMMNPKVAEIYELLLEMNRIRNKIAHDMQADLSKTKLPDLMAGRYMAGEKYGSLPLAQQIDKAVSQVLSVLNPLDQRFHEAVRQAARDEQFHEAIKKVASEFFESSKDA